MKTCFWSIARYHLRESALFRSEVGSNTYPAVPHILHAMLDIQAAIWDGLVRGLIAMHIRACGCGFVIPTTTTSAPTSKPRLAQLQLQWPIPRLYCMSFHTCTAYNLMLTFFNRLMGLTGSGRTTVIYPVNVISHPRTNARTCSLSTQWPGRSSRQVAKP